MLFFVVDKCCTRTNAIPQSEGVFLKKVSKASKPPADAPIPTTGMGGFTAFLEGVFDFLPAFVLSFDGFFGGGIFIFLRHDRNTP